MTSMIESVAQHLQDAEIYVLVRKGNESVLQNNPHIRQLYVFDKKAGKVGEMLRLVKEFRRLSLDVVFNCHRFLSSGLLSVLSGAGKVYGFNKNPLSFFYTKKAPHEYRLRLHELDRNHSLLQLRWPEIAKKRGKLYPSAQDVIQIQKYINRPYHILAPASVWFTKQYPASGWAALIERLGTTVVLIGAKSDVDLCEEIKSKSGNTEVVNLAGELSLLQSTALMQTADAVWANDSAPTHMASVIDVETHTIFCSTTPIFGFGPSASKSYSHETKEHLLCRPCGIHGKASCPEGHFKCSQGIF
ncbi:glycosyltransferase family 9 protein [bacterium]|nr:glycosyltransferase family 9 protein [bacterium]